MDQSQTLAIDYDDVVVITPVVPTLHRLGHHDLPHRLGLRNGASVAVVMVRDANGKVYNWQRSVGLEESSALGWSYTEQDGVSEGLSANWGRGPWTVDMGDRVMSCVGDNYEMKFSPSFVQLREGMAVELSGSAYPVGFQALMPHEGNDRAYRGFFYEVSGRVNGVEAIGFLRLCQLFSEGEPWAESRIYQHVHTAWWTGYTRFADGRSEVSYLVTGAGQWGWEFTVTNDGVVNCSNYCRGALEMDEGGFPAKFMFKGKSRFWHCESFPRAALSTGPNQLARWTLGEMRQLNRFEPVDFSLGLLEGFRDYERRMAAKPAA